MKSYLLIGISVLFLLFTLSKPSLATGRWVSPEQSVLKKACNKDKYTARRTCKKKCLSHQTHSSTENSAGTVADCGSPVYALAAASMAMPPLLFFLVRKVKGNLLVVAYLPPPLKQEPNPPQYS